MIGALSGINMISGFPVFANHPFLRTLKHFILTDLGSHTLDLGRFLFGEANSLYCQAKQVHPDIAGEDHGVLSPSRLAAAPSR